MNEITIKQAQETVDNWIKTYGNWHASWPVRTVNSRSKKATNIAI